MSHSLARTLFLIGIIALALLLVLAIYQVPQPWRGILVCWLLFLSTGGAFILRILRHYAQIKTAQAQRSATEAASARPQAPRPRKPARTNLQVVTSDSLRGAGRYTIR